MYLQVVSHSSSNELVIRAAAGLAGLLGVLNARAFSRDVLLRIYCSII